MSVYSDPDANLLRLSSKALWVCQYTGVDGLRVIPIQSIVTCVAMPPYGDPDDRLFALDKMGLDVGFMAGDAEDIPDE